MPYVFTDPESTRIVLFHHKPELLSDERRAAGTEVAEVPDPPTAGPDEQAVPHLDSGQVVYHLEPRELTADEKLAALEDAVDTLILDSLGGL